jgi:hypothetical protein
MPKYIRQYGYERSESRNRAAINASYWVDILAGYKEEFGTTEQDVYEAFVYRAWEADQLAKKERKG